MEDGTIAVENMVFRGGGKEKEDEKEEDKRNEANERGGEERASSSGVVSKFISNLVSAEDGKVEGKDEEKGGGGGGVIAHLISNLVSPLSSPRDGGEMKKRKVDLFDVEIEGRSEDGVSSISPEEDGGGNGGTISNLISNFFHQSEGEGGEKNEHGKEEVKVVVGESKQVKTEENGGGGGIISNLVSHLPTSLPDDAAPAPDEAAILIHSIIHD